MKRKNVLLLLSTVASLAFVFGAVACDNNKQTEKIEAYEYRIDRPAYLGKEDEVLTLNIFTDDPAPDIVWASQDESIATVSQTGEVVMKKVGKTKITATVADKVFTCELTVDARLVDFVFDADAVEISTIKDEYETSQMLDLRVDVNYTELENPTIIWTTGDPSIATVENGVVTAVKKGFTNVTASVVVAGRTYQSSLNVSVYPYYEHVSMGGVAFTQSAIKDVLTFDYSKKSAVEYVKFGDNVIDEADYTFTGNTLQINVSALGELGLGKHYLQIAEEHDETMSYLYKCPVAIATYVVNNLDTLKMFMANVGTSTAWGSSSTVPTYFALSANINCAEAGALPTSAKPFQGTFDGMGYAISNMTIGTGGRGMFGAPLDVASKVFDLALVDVTVSTGSYGGALCGIMFGKAENIFISGKNNNTIQTSMLCNTYRNATLKNCVIIDNGNLGNTAKRFSSLCGIETTKYPEPVFENVFVVTNGYAIHATAKVEGLQGNYPNITANYTGVTQMKHTEKQSLLNALKTLNSVGCWRFDEASGKLSMFGNTIYTYSYTIE